MSDRQKFIALDAPLYDFICESRSHTGDALLAELRSVTDELGDDARMQISPEQGSFLRILTAATGARNALEIGTFTGYSSICIARGLPDDGRLTCLDVNREWTQIAERYWNRAGIAERIELLIGPALETLTVLNLEKPLDLVFIDALKTEYAAYFEAVLPLVRPNGLILFDNMLWGGSVTADCQDESGKAVVALNRKLAADPRVETVLLPVADGIQMCRVR
jgi:caffeoyl-CoA O-methyltransferase